METDCGKPASTSATTFSFSSRSREQVEYTSRPPGASRRNAAARISRCRTACRLISSTETRCRISGFRANVPVPLHGTSQRIRSNVPSSDGNATASASTVRACAPAVARRSASTFNRRGLASVASNSAPARRRAMTKVLPPGAAQQSQTLRASGLEAVASSATSRDPSSITGMSASSANSAPHPGSRWSASQIEIAAARPYAATHRSTNHSGCPNRSANAAVDSCNFTPGFAAVDNFRSTAFTMPTAKGAPARTNSTLSLRAACAGMRSRCSS